MSPRLSRPVATLIGALASLLFCFTATSAFAQTADQIKAFQSLPKDQRDALMKQLGLGGATGQKNSPNTVDPNTIQVQQSPVPAAETESDTEFDPKTGLPKVLHVVGGEQVLVGLEFIERDEPTMTTETLPDGRQVTHEVKRPRRDPDSLSPDERRRADPDSRKRLEALRERILAHNPYELSRYGILQLPGLEPIPLAGLTQKQARERLALDPALRDFVVGLTIQRLKPLGDKALKPYGYELFRGRANAFIPGSDVPVSSDYRVNVGDVFDIELYGAKSQTVSVPVARDGTVSIPDIGPVNVGGMAFGAAKSAIERGVDRQLNGAKVRVNLSNLRATRVFVLGDAEQPGSYVLSGAPSVTAALFASGGVREIGSLRSVEVKREGRLVRKLDLYDVLLNGDTANDVRLETGDVVFVPPVGSTVGVDGEVRRPAIYELNHERSIGELVSLAGGLTTDADPHVVSVERIDDQHQKTMVSVDLDSPAAKSFALRRGDIVHVARIRPVVGNAITVTGFVYRAGSYQYHEGICLTDVLTSVDDLRPNSDVHYLLVRREDPATRTLSVFSADLAAALRGPHGPDDLKLAPRDQILVFERNADRDILLAPLMEDLRRQSGPGAPAAVVSVIGRVNSPGKYPLEPGMRVSDVLRAGGGLQDSAYSVDAELTRYTVEPGDRRKADLYRVDLAKILEGDATADTEIQPYDVLTIKQTPDWGRVETVEIAGEVRFPGVYQIRRGETLRSVMTRAGGLSPTAFGEGAVFTREDLKKREREQLDQLATRLQADIAVLSLQSSQTNPSSVQAITAGQGLLDQLHDAKPVGRLVIDLDALLAGKNGGGADVTLRQGDRLVVPRRTQEVSVLGEVQSPTSHLYKPHQTRDEVIALSGGVTSKADRKRIYVVRANGSVVGTASTWGSGSGDTEVHPGDTVVVPLDAEKMRPLPLWTAVTTIIYNLAVATAAIAHF